MEDKIIDILRSSNGISFYESDFYDKLNLNNKEDYEKLAKALVNLTENGILYRSNKNKYCLFEDSHLLKGRVDMTSAGDAFIIVEGLEDIYVNKKNLNGAMDDDIVAIELRKGLFRGKYEGRVVNVIKRSTKQFVCEVYNVNGVTRLREIGKKQRPTDLLISNANLGNAGIGSIVRVDLVQGKKQVYPVVVEVLGHVNNPLDDIKSYIYKYGFSTSFSNEAISQLDYIPNEITPDVLASELKRGRIDLRGEVITTMDGADTKDIDDAISIKKLSNGNYLLGVHIADVSHYVEKNSPIDLDAYERGTSIYFPGGADPMLPEKLSNGICSLNPREDRFATTDYIEFNDKGEVVDHAYFESIITSKLKMTYEKVNEILDNDLSDYDPKVETNVNLEDDEEETYKKLTNNLKLMREAASVLLEKMKRRGYIEFESNECKILVDENGVPYEIKSRLDGTGQKIIEVFMILRNEDVASNLDNNDLPDIFRVHDRPDPLRLQSFIDFLMARGITFNGPKKEYFSAKDLQKLIYELKDRPDARVLSDMAIRSQSKAIYSNTNIGHFGLGSKCYSHDTSPIRRYPDLTQHRIMKDFLNYLYDPKETREKLKRWGISMGQTLDVEVSYNENFNEEIMRKVNKWDNELPEICAHCSEKERDADSFERDVDKMKKAEYMQNHIGEEYVGIISGITNYGIFVALENTVEGMIKIEDLPSNNYHYDEKTQILYGSNNRYQIGDILEVKVIGACKENGNVDFILASHAKFNQEENKVNKKKKRRKGI